MKYFGLILLLISVAGRAENQLILNGFSLHTDKSDQPNQRNIGAGLALDIAGHELQAGTYKNSWYRTSHYLIDNRFALNFGVMKYGYFIGVADGYPIGTGIVPTAGLVGRLSTRLANITARFFPTMETKNSAVLSIEIGFNLGD